MILLKRKLSYKTPVNCPKITNAVFTVASWKEVTGRDKIGNTKGLVLPFEYLLNFLKIFCN